MFIFEFGDWLCNGAITCEELKSLSRLDSCRKCDVKPAVFEIELWIHDPFCLWVLILFLALKMSLTSSICQVDGGAPDFVMEI